jgi:hypothetical protein
VVEFGGGTGGECQRIQNERGRSIKATACKIVVAFHAAGRSRIIGGYWIGEIQAEMAVLCYALDVWEGLVWLGVWAVKEGVRSEKKSPSDASDEHTKGLGPRRHAIGCI